jgi:archaellum component FlaC
MKNQKMTIEDLAMITQRGFESMDKRFDDIKEWQKSADGRLDVIEHELISIKKDLQNVIYRHEFENLKDRVKNLEMQLASAKRK